MTLSKKAWDLLARLADEYGNEPFERWALYYGHSSYGAVVAELGNGGNALLARVAADSYQRVLVPRMEAALAAAVAAAHAAIDAGDYGSAKHHLSEADYQRGLLADKDPWYVITRKGHDELAAHRARVAKRAPKPEVA